MTITLWGGSPFYRWQNWDSESFSNLAEVVERAGSWLRIQTHVFDSMPVLLLLQHPTFYVIPEVYFARLRQHSNTPFSALLGLTQGSPQGSECISVLLFVLYLAKYAGDQTVHEAGDSAVCSLSVLCWPSNYTVTWVEMRVGKIILD